MVTDFSINHLANNMSYLTAHPCVSTFCQDDIRMNYTYMQHNNTHTIAYSLCKQILITATHSSNYPQIKVQIIQRNKSGHEPLTSYDTGTDCSLDTFGELYPVVENNTFSKIRC